MASPNPNPNDDAAAVRAQADRAWRMVREHLAPTPVLRTELAGVPAWLKAETFQPIGAYKVRGALSVVDAAPPGQRLVTPSAGNHGLGMAYAAAALGRDVTVVVSREASRAKIDTLRRRPIRLVLHGETYDEAEAHATALAAGSPDVQLVSGYDDIAVIAGATTIGRELEEQLEGPLTVLAPLGGGGLCSGLCVWAEDRESAGTPTRVIGIEAAASTAMSATLAAGHDVTVEVGDTIADSLTGNLVRGARTPWLIRDRIHRVVQVDEAAIRAAMLWLFGQHGLVVEGAGAVGVAALLSRRITEADLVGAPVVVLSGRNITPGLYAEAISASDARAPGR